MTDTPSRVLAEATDYTSLLDAFRRRAHELKITRIEIDEIAGLTGGHASKLLAPNPLKRLGLISLGPLLGALALKLVIVADDAMLPRVTRQVRGKDPRAGRSFGRRRRQACEVTPQLDSGAEATI